MALEDTTVPYEILVRFSPTGELQGAHMIRRRIVKLDGETLKDEPGDAEPLSLDGGSGTLWGVLDEAQANALSTATSLRDDVAARDATIEELQATAADAVKDKAAAERDRDAALEAQAVAERRLAAVQAALVAD